MNIQSGNKNAFEVEQKNPVSASALENGNDENYQQEIAAMQDDENINLDDALDDNNENPMSHTLVDATENSGSEEFLGTQGLEGEDRIDDQH